jgi:hypothetical protein
VLSARLRDLAAVDGDRHRQRRLLVQDLADAVARLDEEGPVLMVLEDLHWADQLSLEVVGRLATRLAARAMLLAGTYRSDELEGTALAREARALAGQVGALPIVAEADRLLAGTAGNRAERPGTR